jgi:hypothetical protein
MYLKSRSSTLCFNNLFIHGNTAKDFSDFGDLFYYYILGHRIGHFLFKI